LEQFSAQRILKKLEIRLKEALQGKQIIAVVNIGVKKIAHYESQCLVLGAKEADDVILLAPDSPLANGQQIL
jgi:tRNA-binding protein